MTRRDYIDIAQALRNAVDDCGSEEEVQGIKLAAFELGNLLQSRSTGFNRKQFLENCGLPFP